MMNIRFGKRYQVPRMEAVNLHFLLTHYLFGTFEKNSRAPNRDSVHFQRPGTAALEAAIVVFLALKTHTHPHIMFR